MTGGWCATRSTCVLRPQTNSPHMRVLLTLLQDASHNTPAMYTDLGVIGQVYSALCVLVCVLLTSACDCGACLTPCNSVCVCVHNTTCAVVLQRTREQGYGSTITASEGESTAPSDVSTVLVDFGDGPSLRSSLGARPSMRRRLSEEVCVCVCACVRVCVGVWGSARGRLTHCSQQNTAVE